MTVPPSHSSTQAYAHTHPGHPNDPTYWELLFASDDNGHLQKVARYCAAMAQMFGSGSFGWIAGFWHDLGKYHPNFARRLYGEAIQVEHATAGAAHVDKTMEPPFNKILASVIAGHHAGLANFFPGLGTVTLDERIRRGRVVLSRIVAPKEVLDPSVPIQAPQWLLALHGTKEQIRQQLGFFTRMLFSALVDADSLATEAFTKPDSGRQEIVYDSLDLLRERLDAALDQLAGNARASLVNAWRQHVLDWCRAAAEQPPGFFSLNVPTGGGKTLASMSFALRHACRHSLRRVIAVVPFTSIIEQNASEYAERLGEGNVIEHHSNLDDSAELENRDPKSIRRQFACENWDAPIIMTTGVQFFESLLSNRRSRCRKLHNIARSVIILDEAQCLPTGCVKPVLHILDELVAHYGCSVVLCTATQPALHRRPKLPQGLANIRPIVPEERQEALHRELCRVRIHWPRDDPPTPYEELAAKIVEHPCVLTVVHGKKDARKLTALLAALCPGDPLFHLSTNMHPVHRRRVIAEIRQAVERWRTEGVPCRVVSTQLIEAGVDLDFPVVFTRMAGLDSIAQAAGRCNREGRLTKPGDVFVFISETAPPKELENHYQIARSIIMASKGEADFSDPSVFIRYSESLFCNCELDDANVMGALNELALETAAQRFHLIKDTGETTVIVPEGAEVKERIREIRHRAEIGIPIPRHFYRALQPYSITVRARELLKFGAAFEPLVEGSDVRVLDLQLWPHLYDPQFGFDSEGDPNPSSYALIS